MNNQTIDRSADATVLINPFPGLRPFEFDESHLFFGRDGQSERLITKLAATRFLAVVGTSGSGKSSLVRAGLLPALYSGFMPSAGSAWRIAVMRPGNDPLGNLARALNAPEVFGSDDEANRTLQIAITEATLRRGSLGLVEAAREQQLPTTENLLVVADQFEELFRVEQGAQEAEHENDRAAFVKLLLAAKAQREVNIYIVLTMRSDYLGDCAQFWDLPEAINESQYLIPRLTREQIRVAITGPIFVGGAEATPRLINRLLNDVGDNPDQLPLLQHALMRTWDNWMADRQPTTSNRQPIDLPHYEAVGMMSHALSLHADEAFNELPDDRHRIVAERVFKALTEKGTDNREIRRPTTLGQLCLVADANLVEVKQVIETFRAPGRSFLMPPTETKLTAESLIDISHESLMRNWLRLKDWVEDEANSARIYRRLAETAGLYLENKAGLWRDPDLQLALDWQAVTRPNKHWAERYDKGYDAAIAFLEKSEAQRTADLEAAERQQREEAERTKRELAAAQALAEAQRQSAEAERLHAEEQQQRLEEQTKAAVRLRRFIAALIAVALFALAIAVFAFAFYREAQAANVKAQSANVALEAASEDLKKQIKEAKDARLDADNQRDSANTQRDIAGKNLNAANQQRQLAVKNAEEAKRQERTAIAQSEEARTARVREKEQREFAEKSLKLAVARQLRNVAVSEWNDTGEGVVLSSLLAAESLKFAWTPEGYEALARGLNILPRPPIKAWEAYDDQPVLAVTYSHNGRWLATKSTKQVKVWDVASREEVAGMEAPSDQHTSMFFSPDDKWLVAGCGRVACVWETQTWKEREKLPNGGKVWSVAFSSDSSLLATASYHSEIAQVYETANWKPIAQIKPGGVWVSAVAFIPQSHLLVVSGGSTKVWEITEPTRPLAEIISRSGVTDTIALSPDGGWLATEGGLWEVSRKDNKTVSFKKGEKKGGIPLAFSPDGRYLVTASSGARTTTQIWEVATGREVTRLATSMTSATFSPDGHWLTTGQPDGTIKEWAVDAKEAIRLPHGDQVKVNAVAYSPDGQWLATGSSDHLARVFQTSDWQEVVKMEHEKAVSTTAFSPDGRWLITLNGNTIQLFETATWHNVITKKYEDEVSAVAFNSDGRRLIAVSGNTVQLFVFEAASWREVRPMVHEGGVESLSHFFSPDGKWLATKTKGDCNRYEGLRRLTKTRVWDVATGDEVAWVWHKDDDMSCHKYPPGIESQATSGGRKALALEAASWPQAMKVRVRKEFGFETESRDKQWTVSKEYGGEVLLSATNTTGKDVRIPHAGVNDLDFSPNGRWLVTAGDDGTVRLWSLWKDDLIDEACARLPRNLTREEWKKYLNDIPYRETCPGLPVPEK